MKIVILAAMLAMFSTAYATPTSDAINKAKGEHYVNVGVAAQDRDIALAKCKKLETVSKRKVCRANAEADYKSDVAGFDAKLKKATADAELSGTKAEVKAEDAAAKAKADADIAAAKAKKDAEAAKK